MLVFFNSFFTLTCLRQLTDGRASSPPSDRGPPPGTPPFGQDPPPERGPPAGEPLPEEGPPLEPNQADLMQLDIISSQGLGGM